MNLNDVARNLIALIIVGATVALMTYQIPIPDAWWTVAVAVIAFMFPRPNNNGSRQKQEP